VGRGVLGPTRRWTFEGRVLQVSCGGGFSNCFMITSSGFVGRSHLRRCISLLHLAASRAPLRSVIVDRASPSSMQSACNQHAIVDHPHRPSERQ
jgi:hypothetical protein